METSNYEILDLPENSTKQEVFKKYEELYKEYKLNLTPSRNDDKVFKMQNNAFKALNKQFEEIEKQRTYRANHEPIHFASKNSQTNAPFNKEKSEASGIYIGRFKRDLHIDFLTFFSIVDFLTESLEKMSLENRHENNSNETKSKV